MKTTIYSCDIKTCKRELVKSNPRDLQVIFFTEQTEGYPCPPYVTFEKLDLCEDCFNNVLKGRAISGRGAQGFNDYQFMQEAHGDKLCSKYKLGTKLFCVVTHHTPINSIEVLVSRILFTDDGYFYGERFKYDIDEFHKESDCFPTREEAEAECRRRNGK